MAFLVLPRECVMGYDVDMRKDTKGEYLRVRIKLSLRENLEKIASRDKEENISRVVRQALQEYVEKKLGRKES